MLSETKMQEESSSESTRRQAEVLRRLRSRFQNKDLVIIVGAGVTLNATADASGIPLPRLTWAGLIRNGLDYLVDEGYADASHYKITKAYGSLDQNKPEALLDAANVMTAQMRLNGQLPTWLESVFGNLSEEIRHPEIFETLQALHMNGVTLLSTNYDDLLERACGLRAIGRSDRDQLLRFKSRDLDGVLHLHGIWRNPDEVVLDSTDYYQILRSDEIQNILKTFLEYKTIIFLGCGSGVEDPNFSALLKWAGDRHENIPNRHCLLVRDGDSLSHKLLIRLKYGTDYHDLVPFLRQLLDDPSRPSSTSTASSDGSAPASTETISKWLSPFDPKQLHKKIIKVRAAGTGTWFPEGTAFKSWSLSQGPTFLWLRGITGAGKTVLMSTVVDDLLQKADPERGAAYFYCSFDDSASQITVNIFGSILAQLSETAPQLFQELVSKYGNCGADANQKKIPLKVEEISDIILRHSLQRKIFIAIDAVNEACNPLEVLTYLKQLLQSSNVHVMISSINASGMEEFLKTVPCLAIETLGVSDIQGDVDLFVRSFIESHYRMRGFPAGLKERIVRSLTTDTQGMFRWVQCQMVRLADLRTAGAIHKALQTLPPTLDKTYEEILSKISPEDRELAREVLQLLAFSLRPVALSEISEALQITIGLPHLDESKLLLKPKDVVDVCAGLVDFDEKTRIVSMAHHSVKTYLTNSELKGSLSYFRLCEDQGNRALAEMCLTYLSFDAFSSGPCETLMALQKKRRRFRFLHYATFHWAVHAQRLSKEGTPWNAMKSFFGDGNSERENFAAWVQLLLPELPVRLIRRTPPLYYAASFGLTAAVRYLLDMGAEIEIQGGRFGATPLGIASFRGHVDVVKILLESGADPFAPDEHPGWNSIQWATQNGHGEVLQAIQARINSAGASR